MTSHSPTTNAMRTPSGLWVSRVASGAVQVEALSLLLTGNRTTDVVAVEQFRAFADQHRLCLDETWVALHNHQPVACVLVVPSPGRTGMIFLSPVLNRKQIVAAGELAQIACSHQNPQRLRLIQTLLDPGQKLESRAMTAAGFKELATLLYMQRGPAPPTPLEFNENMGLYHWTDANRPRFAGAILASYQQTRDCPGLLGLRHIDDIIAGHRSTGLFDPALWFALWRGDEPVAVMLLNEVPHRQALELVYLGVSPAFRGQGLARKLLRHAVGLTSQRNKNLLMLAVDRANEPALALYREHRFVETGCKFAMIFTLAQK